ncbi:MerR family transcriptional regulator [Candidatus Dependentiae bacterium]|nr:MerR family transcriptional regulator [Candidatus Dependentiae bacterium]
MKSRKKGFFSISAVAKMFSVHQQTIRLYEKEGLITPKRSEGNTRLFSEDDVDRLEEIIHLTHTIGINLAGVEMILRLQKQIKKMQREMNQVFQNAQDELNQESSLSKEIAKEAAAKIVCIRKKKEEKNLGAVEEFFPLQYDKDKK